MKSVDGVLYSRDGTILYAYPAAKSGSSYTIPKEAKKIYKGAFLACENLKEILIEEGNLCYESADGVLIEKESQCLLAYPAGKEGTNYEVPDTVEEFSQYVFYGSMLKELIVKERMAKDQLDGVRKTTPNIMVVVGR